MRWIVVLILIVPAVPIAMKEPVVQTAKEIVIVGAEENARAVADV